MSQKLGGFSPTSWTYITRSKILKLLNNFGHSPAHVSRSVKSVEVEGYSQWYTKETIASSSLVEWYLEHSRLWLSLSDKLRFSSHMDLWSEVPIKSFSRHHTRVDPSVWIKDLWSWNVFLGWLRILGPGPRKFPIPSTPQPLIKSKVRHIVSDIPESDLYALDTQRQRSASRCPGHAQCLDCPDL